MFNIYVQPDTTNPNKIILQTRDNYYDSGEVKDWSKKLNKDKTHTIAFLPEVTSKTLTLTYGQDKDVLNTGYLQNVAEVYGQVKYVFDNEYIKNDDKKSLIFGASPFVDTPFGAVVMGINGSEPKTLPRIVYDGGNYPCGTFYIYDYGTTGTASVEYPYTTHFDKPNNPDLDFNFGICDYYFSQSYGATTLNNLSTLYWRRTMAQINSGKLYTVYLDLDSSDIAKLKLNDKIYLDRSYWNINKVIDYNANSNEATKVELLSIDDELVLPKIKTRPDNKPNNSSSLVKPAITQVLSNINGSLTVNSSSGNVVLNGKGNIIDSVVSNAVVIGDGQQVTKNGITTNMGNVNDNFATADLTLTDNRTHDLDDKYVFLNNGNLITSANNGNAITAITSDAAYSAIEANNTNGAGIALAVTNGRVNLVIADVYATDALAGAAGVPTNTVYMTPTGELRIKL
jgi:hypothetical protein